MVPGEYKLLKDEIECNADREILSIRVQNCGDRPIQVGSHIHFYEVNPALHFLRSEAFGKRLNIPAGTATRFEPGEEKTVVLTDFGGEQAIYGVNRLTDGLLAEGESEEKLNIFLKKW
ncbi:Urease subunit beta [compost metagenome]